MQNQLHIQLGTLRQRCNVHCRVQDLHLAAAGNAARGHLTLAFGGNVDGDGLLTVELGDESLDVQDDLYDILLYTGDGGKLVLDSVDLNGRNGHAGKRGEQNPAQAVAQGNAKATVQRLGNKFAIAAIGTKLCCFDLRLDNFDHSFPSLNQLLAYCTFPN